MRTDNETSLKKNPQLLRRGILKKGLHRFSLEGSSESPAHTGHKMPSMCSHFVEYRCSEAKQGVTRKPSRLYSHPRMEVYLMFYIITYFYYQDIKYFILLLIKILAIRKTENESYLQT